MGFQLVRAGDTEIAVWQIDHGHIYMFEVCPDLDALEPAGVRDVPGAAEPAAAFATEALTFATAEARSRKLIGASKKRPRNGFCQTPSLDA